MRWCITASLNYKNTMINGITMETVACLRSKCHLKQNLIPSWPWSFRHTCELQFQFPVQNKIHKQKFFSDTRTGILGSIAGPCDFLPARSDKFQKVCGTYHHKLCKFESHSGKVHLIQHYVIKFVSDLQQVGGFLRILRFPPPKKLKYCWKWH